MNYIIKWYLWYFFVIAFFALIYSSQKKKYLSEDSSTLVRSNNDDFRASTIFVLLLFLPLILIAGFREQYSVGDTWLYVNMFLDYPDNVSGLSDFITWEEKDTGFIIFSTIIKQIFGDNYTCWLMIIAIISGFCVALSYRRYTSDVVICAFLFFASTDFVSWMMNGMRQFLVASILFAIFPLVQKRKYIPFVLIVLLLYTFHSSALIVIPLYICALGKPFNKKTITILTLCLLAVVFVDKFTDLLGNALETTSYKNTVSEFENDDGTNVLRVIVYSIPAIFAILNRSKIGDDTPEIIKISVNMSLITMWLYVVSMFTSGIYIGRLPIYFSLFNYILLPWEIKTFLKKEQKNLCTFIMIISYLIFFIYQMNEWGIGI